MLANMDDFKAVNEVYAPFFQQPYPARATFEVEFKNFQIFGILYIK
jgi:enamine deaminase RidA (YjgF/YER057c/UK114 family)